MGLCHDFKPLSILSLLAYESQNNAHTHFNRHLYFNRLDHGGGPFVERCTAQ